ncbi:pyridoxamine 5'-phosphate oxidase family protein [Methanococcoides sp. SA1]|nr:pyridoxamine 5'-phosphate oxidase family protein [Methanococcoides sp. SA1]
MLKSTKTLIILLSLTIFNFLYGEKKTDEEFIKVAKETMAYTKYCAMVTIDEDGYPITRTMNPYEPDENMIVWFATHRDSRKVKEIKNNPKMCLYYADHSEAKGYVTITGKAEVIDDKDLVKKMKRQYWEKSIKDWENVLVMIKVKPEAIDLLNYEHGYFGDSKTWRTKSLEMK